MLLMKLIVLVLHFSGCRSLVEIRGIECSNDGSICTQSYCSLTAKQPKLNYANFGFFIARQQKDAFVKTQFFNRYGKQFVEVGPKYCENICNVTEVRSRSRTFVSKLLPTMAYAYDFHCPFQDYIRVRDLHPDIILLPSFIKTQNYKFQISIGDIETNKVYFSVTFHMYSNWV